MKKLITAVDTVVVALEGCAAAHPDRSAIVGMRGFSGAVRALTPQLTRLRDAPVDTPAVRWGR